MLRINGSTKYAANKRNTLRHHRHLAAQHSCLSRFRPVLLTMQYLYYYCFCIIIITIIIAECLRLDQGRRGYALFKLEKQNGYLNVSKTATATRTCGYSYNFSEVIQPFHLFTHTRASICLPYSSSLQLTNPLRAPPFA